jgi:hypothetical protein
MGSNNKESVKGVLLWGVWVIEFGIFMAASIATTRVMGESPFCEDCESWCNKNVKIKIRMIPGQDLPGFMMAGNFESLLTAGRAEPNEAHHYLLEMHYCPKCGGTNTLTVKAVEVTVNKKSKQEEKTKTLIKKMLVSREESAEFQKIFNELMGLTQTNPPENSYPPSV